MKNGDTLNNQNKSISVPVFVSSTFEDLKEYRRGIYDLLLDLGLEPHGMEEFGSRNEPPLQTCLKEVALCKIFIGILGMKYGSIEKSTGKSFTELEYDEALKNELIIHFYLINEENALVHPNHVDTGTNAAKLIKLKKRVKEKHTVSYFDSILDLKVRVDKDLRRLIFGENSDQFNEISAKECNPNNSKDGNIVLTASGTGYYNIGEKILLSGINTCNSNVYLFLTGSGLNSNGAMLEDLKITPISSQIRTFTQVIVDKDQTWEYTWDTSKVAKQLVSGNYMLYAVIEPLSKGDLNDSKYDSIEIRFNNLNISASINSPSFAQGDELLIIGNASGNLSHVYIWILGNDYKLLWHPVKVESDGTYKYKLSTKDLPLGQYFIIIQHPMDSLSGNVRSIGKGDDSKFVFIEPDISEKDIQYVDISSLKGSDAAIAVLDTFNSQGVKDTYTKLTFSVEKPWISILSIKLWDSNSDYIVISGQTDLAENDELIVSIAPFDKIKSKSLDRIKKGVFNNSSDSKEILTTVRIESGRPYNEWCVIVEKSEFKCSKYRIVAIFPATNTYADKIITFDNI